LRDEVLKKLKFLKKNPAQSLVSYAFLIKWGQLIALFSRRYRQNRALRSFSNFLKLLTDYRSVEAIDGDACHAEALAKAGAKPKGLS